MPITNWLSVKGRKVALIVIAATFVQQLAFALLGTSCAAGSQFEIGLICLVSNPPVERDRQQAALVGSLRGFAAPAAPHLARSYRDAAGQPKYPFVCVGCGLQTKHFAKRAAVESSGVDVEQLHSRELPAVCEVCGAEGAENHHWAPEALFGSESASWPTSFLCQKCHSRWHQIVTPNISGRPKA
jgi:hypothetical protein